jgi:spore germination protein
MEIYIVQPGDTISCIAKKYNIDLSSIIYNNQLSYPYPLVVGQALLLSTGVPEYNLYDAQINGYAYPFIDPDILDQTLPYLSDLSIFSYGFTEAGDLIPPILDDTFMIDAALRFNSAPILTLTPLGIDGTFNKDLISALVSNEEAQQNLIQQLVNKLQTKGFQGVDIDFENISADDRVAFATFVTMVRQTINDIGYPVSVALVAKSSDDQPGYEGNDYALLGAAANYVLLMTYEWGYKFGPPMAVAPLNKVREVVEYAITRIPPQKINLGIPNYGYDWKLPFQQGVTEARTINPVQAVQIAAEQGTEIQFDNTAMSPFFYYTQDNAAHVVWFEDVRSLQAKFDLVKEYGLHGMGYWQIMNMFRANWLLLADNFHIIK